MRKIVISIVADKDSSRYGKLAVHVEENRLESETWYPDPPRKVELLEPLLNELTARSEKSKDPLVSRTLADLKTVQQEAWRLGLLEKSHSEQITEMTLLINQIKEMTDTVFFQVFLVILALCATLYFCFIPFAIAYARRHKYTKTVFLLNLLLGWTGLAWILLLVWAFAGKKKQHKEHRGQTEKNDIVKERHKQLTQNWAAKSIANNYEQAREMRTSAKYGSHSLGVIWKVD